jgi:hypothetical protein
MVGAGGEAGGHSCKWIPLGGGDGGVRARCVEVAFRSIVLHA